MASSMAVATIGCVLAVSGCSAPARTQTTVPPRGVERHAGPDPSALVREDGYELGDARTRHLARAARRLGEDLTAYLYAERRRGLRMSSATDGLRATLARRPPFVPADLRGTPAALRGIELTPQGRRAAIVRILVEDRR